MTALDTGIVVAIVTTTVMALMVLAFFLLRDQEEGPDRREIGRASCRERV